MGCELTMKIDPTVQRRMIRNAALSLFIYALPVLLMFLTLYLTGSKPWEHAQAVTGIHHATSNHTHGYGFMLFIIVLGVIQFSFGLYGHEWTRNEKALDLACFAIPKLLFAPFFAWFSLTVLPRLFPSQHNVFGWVSFFWGVLILCIADDLTQYWYHRVHHEIPWLWRFHRTHHSAPYMGMSMAGRQNAIYSIFFSQTYLTSILVYLRLGPAAVVVLGVKSTITTLAHSSIPWDKPLPLSSASPDCVGCRASHLDPSDASCASRFEHRRWNRVLQG
jgi:sterol desaturase/sphingolipid hydroxylase (fatty acid hydroxylase superfamily)